MFNFFSLFFVVLLKRRINVITPSEGTKNKYPFLENLYILNEMYLSIASLKIGITIK